MADLDDNAAAADHRGQSAEGSARAGEKPESGASARAAAWMLEAAAIQPGEHILEVACGAGRVGLQAAEIVGPSGVVVCSDVAEPIVEAVRERIAQLSITNAEAWVLDATRLALDGERFHVVLCRFGYMLLGDPAKALRQSRGALRSDGRLALAVWGAADQNPWLSTILSAVIAHFDAAPPTPGTPGPFALGDPEQLSGLLDDAGFVDVSVSVVDAEQSYDSLEDWWREIRELGGPLAAVLGALPEAAVTAIRERAFAAAAEYVRADGKVVFPAQVLGARGVRPMEPIPE